MEGKEVEIRGKNGSGGRFGTCPVVLSNKGWWLAHECQWLKPASRYGAGGGSNWPWPAHRPYQFSLVPFV